MVPVTINNNVTINNSAISNNVTINNSAISNNVTITTSPTPKNTSQVLVLFTFVVYGKQEFYGVLLKY
jgi:NDP-sugar pyrophosphorylase family protein